ncbi:MAG: hypothetical protein QOF37_412 [Thermoleophilaceae bacterium]|jgi:hypothetical protein|nr:hypothetical protein [Thermoleophilaceae bacterium]
MAKTKKPAGGKKKAGKKGAASASGEVRLADHPRARRQINLAKSYAGLGSFGLVAYLAWQDGFQFVDVATRAMIWGIAIYVLVWAMGVIVWRHIAVAEVRAAERRWREHRAAQNDQVAKLKAVLDENGLPTSGTGAM